MSVLLAVRSVKGVSAPESLTESFSLHEAKIEEDMSTDNCRKRTPYDY